jgi:hypothetical protein
MKKIITVLFAIMIGATFMLSQAEAKKAEKDIKPVVCNDLKKADCEKNKDCQWIKGKKGEREGYCRAIPKKK